MRRRWCGVTSAVTAMPRDFASRRMPHRAHRGDVSDVVPRLHVLGEEHVARDDHVLGDARPAAQAEPRGHAALVHLRRPR